MPSQANAKHADTSHAQNRRSPHLYPPGGLRGPLMLGYPSLHPVLVPTTGKLASITKKADDSP